VSLVTNKTKFSAALSSKSEIAVEGVVKGGRDAFITKVGRFDVDLSVEGIVLLVRQSDRPGIVAGAPPPSRCAARDDGTCSAMEVPRHGEADRAWRIDPQQRSVQSN